MVTTSSLKIAGRIGIAMLQLSLLGGCGGGSTSSQGVGGTGGTSPTPTISVTPSSASVSTAQSLTVTVAVSGTSGSAADSVVLSSGSYASAATNLTAGNAMITVPAGLLTIGSDTLSATYTPASGSSLGSASGDAVVTVTAGGSSPVVTATSVTYPTKGAPFDAIASSNRTVFVGESGGVEVFTPTSNGALQSSCLQVLPSALSSEGGAFAELSFTPNGVDLAGGIETPGAIFYKTSALSSCSATGVTVSQGPVSADEGSQSVAVTPDGKYAFVSNEYGLAPGATSEGNIGVVSLTTDASGNVTGGTLLDQISTGGQAIAGMLLSPDGTRLYVTSEVATSASQAAGGSNPVLARTGCTQGSTATQINGLLTVIDVSKAEQAQNPSSILATVDAGCSPVRMAETADNSTLWVAARGDNRVLAFSTGMLEINAGNALLGSASTGGTAPIGIALLRSQTLLAVANSNRFGTGPSANLTILSVAYPADTTVLQTVTTGLFPREVHVGSDDATLYLTNYSSDSLQVISTH